MNTIPMRRARLRLMYKGKDISEDISKDLISATWTDKSGKEVDDLSVKLHNKHGRWTGDWFPSKGARLEAAIIVENWNGTGDNGVLPCGTFEIDEIEVGSPPATVDIKAVSSPITSKIRGQAKTKAWDQVKLSQIAGDVAKNAGLELHFDLPLDPEYQREDQLEETDLSFLQGLCSDISASLKVSHDKVIIWDEEQAEARSAALTITQGMTTSVRLKSKSTDVHKSAKVQYHDPETNEEYEYEHEADDMANLGGEDIDERVLVINQRCKNPAEAERLAKKSLRDKNKNEVTGSISLQGNIQLVSGINVMLSGFGRFDGKYVIDSATHSIGGGYTTAIEIRRALVKGSSGKGKKGKEKDPAWLDLSSYGKDIYKNE